MQLTNAIKLKKKMNIMNYNKKSQNIQYNNLSNESTTDYINIESNDLSDDSIIESSTLCDDLLHPCKANESININNIDPVVTLHTVNDVVMDSFDTNSSDGYSDHIYDIADNVYSSDEDEQNNNVINELNEKECNKTNVDESLIKRMNELKNEYIIEQQNKKQKIKK
jgi:hypothetical protein